MLDQADSSVENPSVVDLFCGAGGLAHGFKLEGFQIAAGVDVEPACRFPFEKNNGGSFHLLDVAQMTAADIDGLFLGPGPRILVGCAPCQPFSTYNQKNSDPQFSLVDKFADLIVNSRPDVISMENVPRLAEYGGGALFLSFVRKLRASGYHLRRYQVFLPEYGLPQRRTRLVVLGSLHGPIKLEPPKFSREDFTTVESVIGNMRPISAGEADSRDRLHCASAMSELNTRRIRASKPGGTWRDWPEELVSACHRADSGKGYGSVYGRMEADAPSPTITTQFYGFGNGRFGHPSQDRALSLREGALLQSFPPDYSFVDPREPLNMRRTGKLIGNAVPPTLGRVIARSVGRHLSLHGLMDAAPS